MSPPILLRWFGQRPWWTALALRAVIPLAAIALAHPRTPLIREPDSAGYLVAAESLAGAGRFESQGRPEIVRTPGYPLFLTPGVQLGSVVGTAIVLQVALGAWTVWLVWRLGLAVHGSSRAALAGAWVMAVEPLSVLYAGKLLTETLFTAMLIWSFERLSAYLRGPAWGMLFCVAAGLAAAMFVRPVAYYLPFAAAVICLALPADRADRRRRWTQALVLALASMAPAGLWQLRNYRMTDGAYAGFSAIAETNLYEWQAAGLLARQAGLTLEEAQRRLEATETPLPDDPARYAVMRRRAIDRIRAAPIAYAIVHLRGMWSVVGDAGTNAWLHYFGAETDSTAEGVRPGSAAGRLMRALRERPAFVVVHGLLSATVWSIWILALAGFVRWPAEARTRAVVLAVPLVYLLLLSGGPAGYHRLRLPLIPFLAVAAGVGYSGWRRPAADDRKS